MATKRVLLPSGKFVTYSGPEPIKAKIKSEEEKLRERKKLEELAEDGGFTPENPVMGGLSEKDIDLIKSGNMSLIDMTSLASTRGVKIPKELEKKEAIAEFLIGGPLEEVEGLTEMEKEQVRAGISIPEMRKLAKARGIKIPKGVTKSADVKAVLLAKKEEEVEL